MIEERNDEGSRLVQVLPLPTTLALHQTNMLNLQVHLHRCVAKQINRLIWLVRMNLMLHQNVASFGHFLLVAGLLLSLRERMTLGVGAIF
jgi:hypothetical protein